jgi:hypothetical protein
MMQGRSVDPIGKGERKKENIINWTKSALLQTKENVLYNCAHWDTLQEFCLSTGTLDQVQNQWRIEVTHPSSWNLPAQRTV